MFKFLAALVKNLLLVQVGAVVNFSTIVIPALTGVLNKQNVNEPIHFTAEQASWYGMYFV